MPAIDCECSIGFPCRGTLDGWATAGAVAAGGGVAQLVERPAHNAWQVAGSTPAPTFAFNAV
jgi:hypothetical protein